MPDGWILKHLNAATGIYQSFLDDHLIRQSLTVGGYRRFLARAFGWERGLEVALGRVPDFAWDMRSRAKSPLIADDLFSIGMTAEEVFAVPSCMDAMDAVVDVPSALGWLFVSERVSFAHGMAYHQLSGSVRRFATGYFDSLVARTTWFDVLKAIDEVVADPKSVEGLITSATVAFRSRRTWSGSTSRQTGRIAALPKNDQVAVNNSESGNASSEGTELKLIRR